MRHVNAVLCMLVCMLALQSWEARAGEPVNVNYVDLGYQSVEPYNLDNIVRVNEYIRETMAKERDDDQWEVYVIPMNHFNRIIFIPLRTEYSLSDRLRKKVADRVDQFLRNQANHSCAK